MRIHLILLPLLFASLAAPAWLLGSHEPVAVERSSHTPPHVAKYQGALSCAAAACHNAGDLRQITGSEFTIWVTSDKHARSYQTLLGERSRKMTAALGLGPAHQAEQCLVCHGFQVPVEARGDKLLEWVPPIKRSESVVAEIARDGVSCELCHGPSEHWRTTHYLDASAPNRLAGMISTRGNLAERVRACAACHIGDDRHEVNHDLIAAGHPRLMFEYAAYHDLMPHHWIEREPGFTARAWLIGQVASARAAVALLRVRAQRASINKPHSVWPEFSESSCYACHHDLQSTARPSTSRKPGSMPWSEWYITGPQALVRLPGPLPKPAGVSDKLFDNLKALMSESRPDPKPVAQEAQRLANILAAWLEELEREVPTAESTAALQRQLLADAGPTTVRDWDSAAQRFLGVAALENSHYQLAGEKMPGGRRQRLEEIRGILLFPKNRDGPGLAFSSDKTRDLLRKLSSGP